MRLSVNKNSQLPNINVLINSTFTETSILDQWQKRLNGHENGSILVGDDSVIDVEIRKNGQSNKPKQVSPTDFVEDYWRSRYKHGCPYKDKSLENIITNRRKTKVKESKNHSLLVSPVPNPQLNAAQKLKQQKRPLSAVAYKRLLVKSHNQVAAQHHLDANIQPETVEIKRWPEIDQKDDTDDGKPVAFRPLAHGRWAPTPTPSSSTGTRSRPYSAGAISISTATKHIENDKNKQFLKQDLALLKELAASEGESGENGGDDQRKVVVHDSLQEMCAGMLLAEGQNNYARSQDHLNGTGTNYKNKDSLKSSSYKNKALLNSLQSEEERVSELRAVILRSLAPSSRHNESPSNSSPVSPEHQIDTKFDTSEDGGTITMTIKLSPRRDNNNINDCKFTHSKLPDIVNEAPKATILGPSSPNKDHAHSLSRPMRPRTAAADTSQTQSFQFQFPNNAHGDLHSTNDDNSNHHIKTFDPSPPTSRQVQFKSFAREHHNHARDHERESNQERLRQQTKGKVSRATVQYLKRHLLMELLKEEDPPSLDLCMDLSMFASPIGSPPSPSSPSFVSPPVSSNTHTRPSKALNASPKTSPRHVITADAAGENEIYPNPLNNNPPPSLPPTIYPPTRNRDTVEESSKKNTKSDRIKELEEEKAKLLLALQQVDGNGEERKVTLDEGKIKQVSPRASSSGNSALHKGKKHSSHDDHQHNHVTRHSIVSNHDSHAHILSHTDHGHGQHHHHHHHHHHNSSDVHSSHHRHSNHDKSHQNPHAHHPPSHEEHSSHPTSHAHPHPHRPVHPLFGGVGDSGGKGKGLNFLDNIKLKKNQLRKTPTETSAASSDCDDTSTDAARIQERQKHEHKLKEERAAAAEPLWMELLELLQKHGLRIDNDVNEVVVNNDNDLEKISSGGKIDEIKLKENEEKNVSSIVENVDSLTEIPIEGRVDGESNFASSLPEIKPVSSPASPVSGWSSIAKISSKFSSAVSNLTKTTTIATADDSKAIDAKEKGAEGSERKKDEDDVDVAKDEGEGEGERENNIVTDTPNSFPASPMMHVNIGKLLGRGKFAAVYSGNLISNSNSNTISSNHIDINENDSPSPSSNVVCVGLRYARLESDSKEPGREEDNKTSLKLKVALKTVQFASMSERRSEEEYKNAVPPICVLEYLREVKALCALHSHPISSSSSSIALGPHPYIVSLIGVRIQPLTLVMEYMDKGSLGALMEEGDWDVIMSMRQRVMLLCDIIAGISHMHEKGYIHRDIKAHNILVSQRPSADGSGGTEFIGKVADFGTALSLSANEMVNEPCGTSGYTAPEIYDPGFYSYPADIFSFAVLTWELFVIRNAVSSHSNTTSAHAASSSSSIINNPMVGDPFTVMPKIIAGMRPPFSAEHPALVKEMVSAAWLTDATKRPTASSLFHLITGLFEDGDNSFMHLYDHTYALSHLFDSDIDTKFLMRNNHWHRTSHSSSSSSSSSLNQQEEGTKISSISKSTQSHVHSPRADQRENESKIKSGERGNGIMGPVYSDDVIKQMKKAKKARQAEADAKEMQNPKDAKDKSKEKEIESLKLKRK